MWIILALLILLTVLLNIRSRKFESLFVSMAAFYVGVFFVYPLYIIENNSSLYYLYRRINLSDDDVLRIYLSFACFVLGFFLISFLRLVSNTAKVNTKDDKKSMYIAERYISKEVSFLFWFAVGAVLIYLLVGVLDQGRAERGYLIRQGLEQGSWIGFLFKIIFAALTIGVFFTAAATKKHGVVLLISILMIVSLFTGATGRAAVLTFLSVLLIYYFRVRTSYFLVAVFAVFPFIVPILLNMKLIISDISLHHQLPDLVSYYNSEVTHNLILSNFGHPLTSLLFVGDLIELVGYRYFYDYAQGFLFYLRVIGVDVGDSLTYYNTEVLLGVRESIVPTGYLAFGFVQLSYVGVFVSGVFYRLIGVATELVFDVYNEPNNDALKFYFANLAAYTFYIGEVRTMVITFLIPMIVVYLSSRLMLKK